LISKESPKLSRKKASQEKLSFKQNNDIPSIPITNLSSTNEILNGYDSTISFKSEPEKNTTIILSQPTISNASIKLEKSTNSLPKSIGDPTIDNHSTHFGETLLPHNNNIDFTFPKHLADGENQALLDVSGLFLSNSELNLVHQQQQEQQNKRTNEPIEQFTKPMRSPQLRQSPKRNASQMMYNNGLTNGNNLNSVHIKTEPAMKKGKYESLNSNANNNNNNNVNNHLNHNNHNKNLITFTEPLEVKQVRF
jgi:hypothetical protein